MTFEPYNMRELADKIETLIQEAEKANNTSNNAAERKSLDNLLTTPADAAKIAGSIDKDGLISKLRLESNDGEDLWNAIVNLSKDSPVINQDNALAILKAFQKLAPKATVTEVADSDGVLNERYNRSFDDPVSYQHVETALKDASQISPTAKDLALKLAVVLTNGSKNCRLDDGLEGVLNAVVYALDIAKDGDLSELLHMLDDFETKYEGNRYAFNPALWNDLMKNMKKLAKEILVKDSVNV